jgi:hypothetical protein
MDASFSDIPLTLKLSRQSIPHSQQSFYLHWRRSAVRVVFDTFHAVVGWLLAGLSIYCYFCKPSSISSLETVDTIMSRTLIVMMIESLWRVRRVYHRGLGIWFGISKCASCSYINACILTGSYHRVLTKFGGVLNAVEALRYKSPRDIKLLGNPLKSVRPECVVRNTFTYSGIRCSDTFNLSSPGGLSDSRRRIGSRLQRGHRSVRGVILNDPPGYYLIF